MTEFNAVLMVSKDHLIILILFIILIAPFEKTHKKTPKTLWTQWPYIIGQIHMNCFAIRKKKLQIFSIFLIFFTKNCIVWFLAHWNGEWYGIRVQFDRLLMACFFEETMGTDCALENDWVVSSKDELVGRTNINILSQEIHYQNF